MGKGVGANGSTDSRGQNQNGEPSTSGSSRSFCGRCCPMGVGAITQYLSLKCFLVLIFSFALLLSAFFLLLPMHPVNDRFEASRALKLSAFVRGYFRLHNPVDELVPNRLQLENDIYSEIGVPETRVAILSMRAAKKANFTHVIFGVIPHPEDAKINPVSMSVLKSSMIELFLNRTNLTLTSSMFGQPSSFQILKFKGGITVIPPQPAPIWQIAQTLFNFTISNSIYDVTVNLPILKQQLKAGLHLKFDENVYVQATNEAGSTVADPVIVQASVLSETGKLQPLRLKQLAQTIRSSSSSKNLGLNNTVFGKVRSVSLSSYLEDTLDDNPPSSSPAPSPSPSLSPSPAPKPSIISGPTSSPWHSLSPLPSADPPRQPRGRARAPRCSPLPCHGSPDSSPYYHSHCLSPAPVQSPYATSQPPCPSEDEKSLDTAPSPSPINYHSFFDGLGKGAGDLSVPHTTFNSGAVVRSGTVSRIHVTVSVAAICILLFWLH